MAEAIEYNLQITGDCSNTNSGAVSISITGGTPNYTVTWVTPLLSPDILAASGVTKTSLSGGSYVFYISDQSIPINQTDYVNFYISTGCCISLETQDTTCDLPNGQITATTTYNPSSASIFIYKDGVYLDSGITEDNSVVFSNLSAGTYQITMEDYGGCDCSSQTCIIRNSSNFDFGLLVVSANTCSSGLGKLIVTGNTGTPPFLYQWSSNVPNPSLTASTVSGLSAGSYSVVITDATNCSVTKSATITNAPTLIFSYYTVTETTCLSNNGTATFYIQGGTPPYYYILSNGDSAISYSNSYTFSGLAANNYNLQVVDLGLCTLTQSFQVPMEGNFNVLSVTTQNVTCTDYGSISVNLIGNPPFTYTLQDSFGNSNSIVSQVSNYQFLNLTGDTYTLTVSDYLGTCEYINQYTISASTNFSMTTSITGTTCNSNNGNILVEITPNNSTLFTYDLVGYTSYGPTSDLSFNFSGLSTGIYSLVVTDESGCTQTQSATIVNDSSLSFQLYSTSCGLGSQGTVSAIITQGQPPFNLSWSASTYQGLISIGTQQGIYLTGLTADQYFLTVIDNNNCTYSTSIDVTCGNLISSTYQVFTVCNDVFTDTMNQKFGITQMFYDGWSDLTSGSNCILNFANFIVVATIGAQIYENTFYTSYSLTDIPADNLLINTLQSVLNGAYGVGNFNINPTTNTITISSDCNLPYDVLQDMEIKIDVKIEYDFNCQ
jgi:hypothetical protein